MIIELINCEFPWSLRRIKVNDKIQMDYYFDNGVFQSNLLF